MINTNAQIVYMPLHRSIKQAGSSGKAPATTVSTAQKKQTVAPVKQESGPSTTIVTRKNPKAVIPAKKKNIKPQNAKAKTTDSKTPEVKKTAEEKKELPKKVEVKPEVKSQPELEPIKPTQEIKETAIETQNTIVSDNSGTPVSDQNIMYVGQAEMEALALQEFIQNEMAAHWSPPTGIRADVQCVLKIIVSHDGKNNQIVLDQPSNILLFDNAAKRAATQLQPPQWAYGKEILITFKP